MAEEKKSHAVTTTQPLDEDVEQSTDIESRQLQHEVRKFEAEIEFRREEFNAKQEFDSKRLEQEQKRPVPWNTPGGLAVIGGVVTLLTAILTNSIQGCRNSKIEHLAFQSGLIQKAIERADNNEAAAINLNFLWETGLIPDYPKIPGFVSDSGILPEESRDLIPSGKTFAQTRVPPPTSVVADVLLTLGSWNIEHLGRTFGESESGQRAESLANHILLSGVDVLALQEIYDTDDSEETRSNNQLDVTFALLNQQPNQDWRYILFPNSGSGSTSSLAGVAWNGASITLVAEPYPIPVGDTEPRIWFRSPHAVKFSAGAGKTDFVIIPVHMNFSGGTQVASERRRAEAQALVDALPSIRSHYQDDDIIVLGDTNCLSKDEPAIKALTDSGFRDLNADDMATYVGREAPFDRIFVPISQPEFLNSRQYALRSSDAMSHERYLSDHFLALTTVTLFDDDD